MDDELKTKRIRVPKEIKYQVFERDGWRCLSCGKNDNLTIDHIVPVVKSGSNDIENLQTLCSKCNLYKGSRTVDYRNREIALKIVGKINLPEKKKRLSLPEEVRYYKLRSKELETEYYRAVQLINKIPKFIRWIFKIKL